MQDSVYDSRVNQEQGPRGGKKNPTSSNIATSDESQNSNFIANIIRDDIVCSRYGGRVVTRFPPEPNGYLHIGHAKSICLNFSLAATYPKGLCHLRFDDTNPTKEETRFVDSIKEDIRWLGYDWGEHCYYTSSYFEQLYDFACRLISCGKAYVCSLSEEQIREYRGSLTQAGQESPYRDRSVEENLDLFKRMREGEFPDGAHVLRAKIDMGAANLKMRDPLLYRIRHVSHHRTGNRWCIYPMYDFAHCLSDALERITHSICTLEFENNRDVYDWILNELEIDQAPRQIEFARLELADTLTSKRKLQDLVQEQHVSGWDDPRLYTLAALRRRGFPPSAIRDFCERIGVAKANSTVDVGLLEYCVRQELHRCAPRVMCVSRPLKIVIENFSDAIPESLEAPYWPPDSPKKESRMLPFSREIYIERDDFQEIPQKKFFRLVPDGEVRLRFAYIIRCNEVVKDRETGEIRELRCSLDPDSRGGKPADGRKVKGTIHWVSAEHSVPVQLRLYDRLLNRSYFEDEDGDFVDKINQESLIVNNEARGEQSLAEVKSGSRFQFERLGYFVSDLKDSLPGNLVFNRTVTLKDTWAKQGEANKTVSEENPLKKAGLSVETNLAESKSTESRPRKKSRSEAREITFSRHPELLARRDALVKTYNISQEDSSVIAVEPGLADFFEEALGEQVKLDLLLRWTLNELMYFIKDNPVASFKICGRQFGRLVAEVDHGRISGSVAKDVLEEMIQSGEDAEKIIEKRGLVQLSDEDELNRIAEQVLLEHPEPVAQFLAGNERLFGFFIGQAMKLSQGRANPKLLRDAMIKTLEKHRAS